MKLISGIAIALAIGLMFDIWPNNSMVGVLEQMRGSARGWG